MTTRARVLIAYDGSDWAKAAVQDLGRAGLPDDAEAMVLAVANVWAPAPLPAALLHLPSTVSDAMRVRNEDLHAAAEHGLEEAHTNADLAARDLRLKFPGWTVAPQVCNGLPAWEILKLAERWRPDLLVVGSRGRTAVERVLLGSVSQKVLNEAGCSVRIGRGRPGVRPPGVRLVIGVDGSEHAAEAVRVVAARRWPAGTEARLVAADDPFGPSRSHHPEWDLATMQAKGSDETRAWVERVLLAPARTLAAAGLTVSEAVSWGDAVHVVLQEAEKFEADAIVVGARGVGMWHRLLLGSVSAAIAMGATCSVEVIRAAPAR